MTIGDDDDLAGLARAGAAVAEARDTMLAALQAGITTAALDAVGRDVLRRHGARSAPRLAYGFPGWTCISVNDAAAHGVPSGRVVLRDGDMVNVDVSAELDGYWADTGASATVGDPTAAQRRLLDATRAAQRDAMAAARAGHRLGQVARAVERRAHRTGHRVVEDLCGHGVGRGIHERPSVPSVEHACAPLTLWEGLVLAIEPFLSPSATGVVQDDDGWTLRTADGSPVAQFEHTVVVTAGPPIVLTAGTRGPAPGPVPA